VDGLPVRLWTLDSGRGLSARITNYGGVVHAIDVADRHGRRANVALGFGELREYHENFSAPGATYFGAIVGRYANRIAGHAFDLAGASHILQGNNGPGDVHTLHGGPGAWNSRVWAAAEVRSPHRVSLVLSLTDPDGAGGFPGEVRAEVTYTVNDRDGLIIDYRAWSTAPTVINLTNHTYFNLAGEGSGDVHEQRLQINAHRFLPTDATQIPTGEFASVRGTPFDFRAPKAIGRDLRRADGPWGEQLAFAHGYDHSWVLDGSGLRLAAVAQDPRSGRELLLYTTEPGLQLYTGNFLAGELVGTSGRLYRQGDAFALETQHFPDTPHHLGEPHWPSVVLDPGQTFASTTVLRFTTAAR
jgi:aldose 1-epimerase